LQSIDADLDARSRVRITQARKPASKELGLPDLDHAPTVSYGIRATIARPTRRIGPRRQDEL
jgi:hypothetical protein